MISITRKRRLDWRQRLNDFLNEPSTSTWAFTFNVLMMLCILMSVFILLLETAPLHTEFEAPTTDMQLRALNKEQHSRFMQGAELCFTLIFSLEIVLRVVAAKTFLGSTPGAGSGDGRAAAEEADDMEEDVPFVVDVYNWLDIISVLPFYLQLLLGMGTQGHGDALTTLRLLRVLRIFKICRRFDGTEVLLETIQRVYKPLTLPIFFFAVFSFVFGALMYFLEPCYAKDTCQFTSIFSGMYFSVVTMVTVGFGDQVPGLFEARFLAVIIMMFGSIFLSMPLSVIGTEFDAVWGERAHRAAESKRLLTEELDAGKKLLRVFMNGRSRASNSAVQVDITDVIKQKQMALDLSLAADPGEQGQASSAGGGGNRSKRTDKAPIATVEPASIGASRRSGSTLKALVGGDRSAPISPEPSPVPKEQQPATQETHEQPHGSMGPPEGPSSRENEKAGAVAASPAPISAAGIPASVELGSQHVSPTHDASRALACAGIMHGNAAPTDRSNPSTPPGGTCIVPKRSPKAGEAAVTQSASAEHSLMEKRVNPMRLRPRKRRRRREKGPIMPVRYHLLADFMLVCQSYSRMFHFVRHVDHVDHVDSLLEWVNKGSTQMYLLVCRIQEHCSLGQAISEDPMQRLKSMKMMKKLSPASRHGSRERANSQALTTALGRIASQGPSIPVPAVAEERAQPTPGTLLGLTKKVQALYSSLKDKLNAEQDTYAQIREARRSRKLRDKVWLAMEVPNSSFAARALNAVLLVSIILSVAMFGFQTDPQYISFGESTGKCLDVVQVYCDKWVPRVSHEQQRQHAAVLDPGCFVWNGTHADWSKKLDFRHACKGASCYGAGMNFGQRRRHSVHGDLALRCDGKGSPIRPFRYQEELPVQTAFASDPNVLYDICERPECSNAHRTQLDLDPLWRVLEPLFASIFTVELIGRLLTARNAIVLIKDIFFVIDICALLPFYIEMSSLDTSYAMHSFSYSQTSGSYMKVVKMMKVFRMFKMTRHYSSVSILKETLISCWGRLVIPFFMLFVFSMMLAVIFHLFEMGYVCEVVEGACTVTTLLREEKVVEVDSAYEGQTIQVTLDGALTQIPSSFEGLWLALVTITTVGYGRITPQTVPGRLIAVLAMIFGSCYLAMPLFIVGGSFYQCWKKHFDRRKMIQEKLRVKDNAERGVDLARRISGRKVQLQPEQCRAVASYKASTASLERVAKRLHGMKKDGQERNGSVKDLAETLESVRMQLQKVRDEHIQFAKHIRIIETAVSNSRAALPTLDGRHPAGAKLFSKP